MKLKELTTEELECMPYDEIAYLILLESGKKEKLLNLYKKVCKLLKLNFETEQENISDFFEILSTNKKFVMLAKGYWDLQINHKTDLIIENVNDDDDSVDEIEEEEEDDKKDSDSEDIFYESDETDDTVDDDLASLVVVSSEDDESN